MSGKLRIEVLHTHDQTQSGAWQKAVLNFPGATVFHDPCFLKYHGTRFEEHHLGVYKGDELFGLIPLAMFREKEATEVRSPYGGSYGGFVFAADLSYAQAKEVLDLFHQYLLEVGVSGITITPSLPVYHRNPDDTLLFALLADGYEVSNTDLVHAMMLEGVSDVSEQLLSASARRHVKKALKNEVRCVVDAPADDFWVTVGKTFEKHGVSATHTFEQWQWLCTELPDRFSADVAYVGDQPVAGIGRVRITPDVDSAFYICQDPDFQDSQALSLLLLTSVEDAISKGCRVFDLGTSSVKMEARENIFRFKESFGARGVSRRTLTKKLQ